MVIDPYNHKSRFEKWKQNPKFEGVSKLNSDLLVEYLFDMENGINVARTGRLSYDRLNNLKQRMGFIVRMLEQKYGSKRVIDITEREIVAFFRGMREGEILTLKGEKYTSVPDYVHVFKAFWHWYQRVENEKGNAVKDITRYVDTRRVKEPEFVFFTIEDLKSLSAQANFKYRALMWFMFDSGIRAPKELCNIKVSNLTPIENSSFMQLDIPNEVSKTFGRKIKLMLSSKIIQEYIQTKNLKADDYLFPICAKVVNQYLKRLFVKVFGDKKTLGGKLTSNVRMYDFRHSSACYWLPRYKSESALKYRFGWKKSEMIHYYTKLLGMMDTICEEDLVIDGEGLVATERELEQTKKEKTILLEEVQHYKAEVQKVNARISECEKRDDIIFDLLKSLIKQGLGNEIKTAMQKNGIAERIVKMGSVS